MAQDWNRLVEEWGIWTQLAGMPGTSVEVDTDSDEIRFVSREGVYLLKKERDWWVVDESDDRGKWYAATVTCSTVQLAEKYLTWTWASLARTVVGQPQLGRQFQELGLNHEVRQSESERANFVELTTRDGVAVVPISKAVVLSHVLPLPATQLDEILRQGL